MPSKDPRNPENTKEAGLPWQDWILLPLFSLSTICLILALTERIARKTYYAAGNMGRDCLIYNPSTGVRGVPNCVSREKNSETALIEYRFDSCGYRSGANCGSKPPGVYRIVMTGASTPMGYNASQPQSFAALLPAELSRLTGRKVELYNESLVKNTPRDISLHFDRVLAPGPDLILWVLNPSDIMHQALPLEPQAPDVGAGKPQGFLAKIKLRSIEATANSLEERLVDLWRQSSCSILVEHYLYGSQSLYLKSYLRIGEDEAGYLSTEMDANWQSGLREFDGYAAIIAAQSKDAGVPLVAVLLPLRAQAAMISMGEWPGQYDPYRLDAEVRSVITSHGGIYVDVAPDFRNIANPERYYYPIDGHPNAEGHALISSLLAKDLSGGAVPGLNVRHQPQTPTLKTTR